MMYINDIHILWYFVVGIFGLFVGYFVQWCNMRLPEYKKVFCKEFFTTYVSCGKPNYILMIISAILYIAALYFAGNWFSTIKYFFFNSNVVDCLLCGLQALHYSKPFNTYYVRGGTCFCFL